MTEDSVNNKYVEVRFMNNLENVPPVTVELWKKDVVINLTYQQMTAYTRVKKGDTLINIKETTSEKTLMQKNISLNEICTIIISDTIYKYREDFSTPPMAGSSYIRYINSAIGSEPTDLYINDVKIFEDVKFSKTGNPKYAPILLGTGVEFNLVLKYASSEQIITGPIPINFTNKGIYTVISSVTDSSLGIINLVIVMDNFDICNEKLQKDFNVPKYMGKWYQIAGIPQFYDIDCPRATAMYTLLWNGIYVKNTCYSREWISTNTAIGFAYPPNSSIPASLVVNFYENNSVKEPNYLVHKTDYASYSIVGSPDRNSLYILSKNTKMSESLYEDLLKFAKSLGYKTERLVINYHAIKIK